MMRRTIVLAILFSLFAIGSSHAVPPDVNGKVSAICVGGGGIVYFTVAGAQYAGCATNDRYVIDTSAQAGRSQYTLVLSAYLSGQNVTVGPRGECNTMPNDAEDIYAISF